MTRIAPHDAWTGVRVRHIMPSDTARAATLTDRISLSVAWALKTCGRTREDVAQRMSADLGQLISVNMLNSYAAQSRQDHRITLERFIALTAATERLELLDMVTAPFEVAAVPEALTGLIELDLVEARLRSVQDERTTMLRRLAS